MEKFYFIEHDNTDPYFNIASEEYLLKRKKGYYVYVWQNAPSVIVGVNQNAFAEVNLGYTESNGVKVVRRLTGGGAVYHDLNNVCYTVIAPYEDKEQTYHKFTAPVIEYLKSINVNAEFSGRNDITIDGKKISGNAQTVFENRIMHHGTLLFDTDVSALSKTLTANKLKIESKGIKSVRARVTNVKEYLGQNFTIKEFIEGLKNFLKKDCEEYRFNEEDIKAIKELSNNKYSTYEWNMGYSPKGKNVFEDKFDFGIFTLNFDTVDGKVQNANIHGDFFSRKDVKDFCAKLNGTKWEKSQLEKVFSEISDYIVNADGKIIVEKIFQG